MQGAGVRPCTRPRPAEVAGSVGGAGGLVLCGERTGRAAMAAAGGAAICVGGAAEVRGHMQLVVLGLAE